MDVIPYTAVVISVCFSHQILKTMLIVIRAILIPCLQIDV